MVFLLKNPMQVRSSTKRSLNPCYLNGIRGENDIIFLFSRFFLVFQKDETFLKHHKKCEIKNLSLFISVNYFKMLGTGWVNKVFSPRIFINI